MATRAPSLWSPVARRCETSDGKYADIAREIVANATALNDEANALAKLFAETQFLGDNRNFPHAHYGHLMACMGQIDLMSKCEYGRREPTGAKPRGCAIS